LSESGPDHFECYGDLINEALNKTKKLINTMLLYCFALY